MNIQTLISNSDSMIARLQIPRKPSTLQLLVLAAVVQIILTLTVYTIGRLELLQAIDRNGCITALTPDGPPALAEANSMADALNRRGPRVLIRSAAKLHIKLYSLSVIVLRPLFGANILSVLPVNLIFYISILFLAFKLGTEVFDRRTSLTATVAIALWPSLLLHTTQLVKDMIFITALLALILIMTWWLSRTFSLRSGLLTGIAGGVASYTVSLTRSGFWLVILLAIVLTGACLLFVRQIRVRKILWWNVVSAGLLVLFTSAIFVLAPERLGDAVVFAVPGVGPPEVVSQNVPQNLSLRDRTDYAAQRLSLLRKSFLVLNPNSGSDIDADIKFVTALDIVRYLPRMAEIGFLAPFPNQWFKAGKTAGSAGRLLSGLEMSFFYLLEILALIGLWQSRNNIRAWLLCLVCLIGVGALTLAVINVGALYRLRYGFFILLVILGANGLTTSIDYWRQRKTVRTNKIEFVSE